MVIDELFCAILRCVHLCGGQGCAVVHSDLPWCSLILHNGMVCHDVINYPAHVMINIGVVPSSAIACHEEEVYSCCATLYHTVLYCSMHALSVEFHTSLLNKFLNIFFPDWGN